MNVGDLETYERNHMHFSLHKFNERISEKTVIKGTAKVTQKDLVENREVHYKSHETLIGKIGLMCPHCYNYIIRTVNFNCSISILNEVPTEKCDPELRVVNDFRYQLRKCKFCDEWDVDLIPIDVNIVEPISILNKKGYMTKFCCEGHGDKSTNAYILFEDDFIIKFFNTLPITWYYDIDFAKNFGQTCIRCDTINYVEGLMDIKEWVDSLPMKLKNLEFSLMEKDKISKNNRSFDCDKIVQELKGYCEQYNNIPFFRTDKLYPNLDNMKGFSVGESYIQQQPSHSISFHDVDLSTMVNVERFLNSIKTRPNTAVYGALKAFGCYNDENKQ